MHKSVVVIGLLLAFGSPLLAQSINFAFGPPEQQPADTYTAAGAPGFWNAIPAAHGTTTFNLRQLDGALTNVSLQQIGGTELLSDDDPATSGDDQTLLDHYLITHTPVEVCLFVDGLENAAYEVLVYAWMPNHPDVLSYTNSDEEPENPHYLVGGTWSGEHELYVTYARHISIVGPPNLDGRLRVHSGVAPGGSFDLGAACNGLQIRQLPPADLNIDGSVDAQDLALLLGSWGPCRADCPADLNDDLVVGPADLALLLGSWG